VLNTRLGGARGRNLALAFGSVVLAIAGIALVGRRLRVSDQWVGQLPRDSAVREGTKALDALFAGSMNLDIELTARESGRLSRAQGWCDLLRLENVLEEIDGVGLAVSRASDGLRVLASLDETSVAELRRSLLDGTRQWTESEAAVCDMLLDPARPNGGELRIDPSRSVTRLSIYIRDADYERINSIVEQAAAAIAAQRATWSEPVFFGDAWVSREAVRLLVTDQVRGICTSWIGSVALAALILGGGWIALLVSVPTAVATVVVLGAMAALDIPLGIANSMFLALSVGIGLDFGIHVVAATDPARSGHDVGSAFASGIVVGSGLLVLGLSRLPSISELGIMLGSSAILSAIGSSLLLPISMQYLRRRRPAAIETRLSIMTPPEERKHPR
jgi:predicted RND superfamily exporter protein